MSKSKTHRVDIYPVSQIVLDVMRDNPQLFSAPVGNDGERITNTFEAALSYYDDVVIEGCRDRKSVAVYRAVNNTTQQIAAGLFKLAFGDIYYTVPTGYDCSLAEAMYSALDQRTVRNLCESFSTPYKHAEKVELYAEDPLTTSLVEQALSLFDDAYAVAQELVSNLDNNRWLLYDLRITRDMAIVRFGRDLRIVLFEEQYGNERWDGELYMCDGEKVSSVVSERISRSNNRVIKSTKELKKSIKKVT